MKRLKIAILFGGCSEEHDVSVKSATEIAKSIDTQKYEPIYIGIARSGVWKACERPSAAWEDGDCRRAVISPDRETHGLLVAEGDEGRPVHIDAVFPVLHGTTGEDGAVQGLLELAGIPYVGCGIQSSAICMDKSLAYIVARSVGIGTPECSVPERRRHGRARRAHVPRVRQAGALRLVVRGDQGRVFGRFGRRVTAARRYDGKVLLEQEIVGTEVGCAVLGNGSDLIVGEVDQIELRHGIFRIHQEAEPERGSENAVITVPADLPDSATRRGTGSGQVRVRSIRLRGPCPSGHVLGGRRSCRAQRSQHLARLHGVQPLSPHDGRRRGEPLRGDRSLHHLVPGALSMEAGFVFLDEVLSGVRWDAKYATWDNFTGTPVDGYEVNRIVGSRALADALLAAKTQAAALGFGLLLWDAYRPQRAVHRFVEWSGQPEDGRTKARVLSQHRPRRDVHGRVCRAQVRPQPG